MSARFKGRVKLNKEVLEKLQAEIAKAKGSRVHLGVLAGKTAREGEELNNAEIGAVHELGSQESHIPQRSFLRMPIQHKLPEKIKKIKAAKFAQLIIDQGIEAGLKTLGVIGEQVVDEAFASRGFGQWKENAPYTIAKKGSDAPLIDKAFLRKSITSKVFMKGQKQ